MIKLTESEKTPIIMSGGVHIIEMNNYISNVTILPKDLKEVDETFAYIISPYVYPIVSEDQFTSGEVGILIDREKNTYKVNVPKTKDEEEKHSISNIRSLDTDIDHIVRDMIENPEDFLNEKEAEIINMNSNTTTFTIREEDDFLKRAIKEVINTKQINVASYGDKLPKAHDISNIKSVLTGSKNMSILVFSRWCYTLGIKCELHIMDNGEDKIAPLKGEIVIPFND